MMRTSFFAPKHNFVVENYNKVVDNTTKLW